MKQNIFSHFESISFKGNFINGRFVRPRLGREIVSQDPGDLDRPVGRIVSQPSVVEEAVTAAQKAFSAWRAAPLVSRLRLLRRYRHALEHRARDGAWILSRETGKPWSESEAEVRAMIEKIQVTYENALPLVKERRFRFGRASRGVVQRRPRGVIAVLGPFNVPGHIPHGQIVPALLTGNTVVFKPSEKTPFVGQMLAECLAEAGFPKGVFNMVQGDGRVGAALAGHPLVNAVFFTGSASTGERLRLLSASQPEKLLLLEMGGKNAALVLEDAPLDGTVDQIVHGAFSTSGQRCSSTSRVLVHQKVAKGFIKRFLAKVDALRVGYFTEDPFLGPLIDTPSVQRFLQAQDSAERLGYQTLRRGEPLRLARRGHYVTPSVHLWDHKRFPWRAGKNGSVYWDEEIFAPDVALYVMNSSEEMVEANNASRYGLVAGVFTRSRDRFQRLRPALQNGVIHWNRTTAMTPGLLPFGGVKASGNHWPMGLHAVYACTVPVGSVETENTAMGHAS